MADQMVWDKIEGLMSFPELLQKQLQRWKSRRQGKAMLEIGDIKTMEAEILKLENQEDRYNKAYGAGLFTVEQLKSYTTPLREQIVSLEGQIAEAKQQESQINDGAVPDENEIKYFVERATQFLPTLSFEQKRAIVTKSVNQIIGTQRELDVRGHLTLDIFSFMPALSNHVEYKPICRYSWLSKCG